MTTCLLRGQDNCCINPTYFPNKMQTNFKANWMDGLDQLANTKGTYDSFSLPLHTESSTLDYNKSFIESKYVCQKR